MGGANSTETISLTEEAKNEIRKGSISETRDDYIKKAVNIEERVEIVDFVKRGSKFLLVVIVDKGKRGKYAVRVVIYEEGEGGEVGGSEVSGGEGNEESEGGEGGEGGEESKGSKGSKGKTTIILGEEDIHGKEKAEEIAKITCQELFSGMGELSPQQLETEQLKKKVEQLEHDLTNDHKLITTAEKELDDVKDRNHLLEETNKVLVEKITLEEERRKLEGQSGENADKIVKKQLAEIEKQLAEKEKEWDSKQKEMEKMAEQLKIIQEEDKAIAPIKELIDILEGLNESFDKLNEYQNEDKKVTNSVPRSILSKVATSYKISVSEFGAMSRGVNYLGGGIATLGFAEIGGGLTLLGSSVDSIVSGLENLDKKRQEELINLEEYCQRLKKIYHEFSKSLVLPRKMIETILNFSKLVNELQQIISTEKQEGMDEKFEELKKIGVKVEKDLERTIESLDPEGKYMGGLEQEGQEEDASSSKSSDLNNNQPGLEEVIVDDPPNAGKHTPHTPHEANESTPLLG